MRLTVSDAATAGGSQRIGGTPFLVLLAGLCAALASLPASAAPFNTGDVFASVGDGLVRHFDASGLLLETLDTGKGVGNHTTGCAFDSTGNLYVTTFDANDVTRFSGPQDPHVASSFGGGYQQCNPESILFDRSGSAYVGQAGCPVILKFDAGGNPLGQFPAMAAARGTDWIDLAADQCTMFYTSEAANILRFDVCANTQLADFTGALHGPAYALRLLGENGLLVADTIDIHRLDTAGSIVQTYDTPNDDGWFTVNLDPDGSSFWSGDFLTGGFFKFNIASGAVELGPIATGSTSLGGLCVFGEATHGCGNGVVDVDVGEACDAGAANGTPFSCCSSACQLQPDSTPCEIDLASVPPGTTVCQTNSCVQGTCRPSSACEKAQGDSTARQAGKKPIIRVTCGDGLGHAEKGDTCEAQGFAEAGSMSQVSGPRSAATSNLVAVTQMTVRNLSQRNGRASFKVKLNQVGKRLSAHTPSALPVTLDMKLHAGGADSNLQQSVSIVRRRRKP
jgi:hypothetical protein